MVSFASMAKVIPIPFSLNVLGSTRKCPIRKIAVVSAMCIAPASNRCLHLGLRDASAEEYLLQTAQGAQRSEYYTECSSWGRLK